MTEWLSVAAAALARGVSEPWIRARVFDGRIRSRRVQFGRSLNGRAGKWWRVEVYLPDVLSQPFGIQPGSRGSGPVCDMTWARFCRVWDAVMRQQTATDITPGHVVGDSVRSPERRGVWVFEDNGHRRKRGLYREVTY